MELEAVLLERVRNWEQLSRWERSELGRDLRRSGLAYNEIMEIIPVKKSTLATWCKEVKLTPEQVEDLRQRMPSRLGVPVDTNWRRREEVEFIRADAREAVPYLLEEPLWVAGVVLYWGEGTKGRNRLSLANADPRAHRLFIEWVGEYLIHNPEFTLCLHLHEGNDEQSAKNYWRTETGLWDANFIKTFVKPAGTGHRKNILEQGICTTRVRRASNAWNMTMEWVDALTDHFGLADPPN